MELVLLLLLGALTRRINDVHISAAETYWSVLYRRPVMRTPSSIVGISLQLLKQTFKGNDTYCKDADPDPCDRASTTERRKK